MSCANFASFECSRIILAGVVLSQLLLRIADGAVCTVSFGKVIFCVAVDRVCLTGYSYQINVCVLSYVVC